MPRVRGMVMIFILILCFCQHSPHSARAPLSVPHALPRDLRLAPAFSCRGTNTHGQLGLGDKAPRGTGLPMDMGDKLPPVDLGDHKAVSLALGELFTCAIIETRDVMCW